MKANCAGGATSTMIWSPRHTGMFHTVAPRSVFVDPGERLPITERVDLFIHEIRRVRWCPRAVPGAGHALLTLPSWPAVALRPCPCTDARRSTAGGSNILTDPSSQSTIGGPNLGVNGVPTRALHTLG